MSKTTQKKNKKTKKNIKRVDKNSNHNRANALQIDYAAMQQDAQQMMAIMQKYIPIMYSMAQDMIPKMAENMSAACGIELPFKPQLPSLPQMPLMTQMAFSMDKSTDITEEHTIREIDKPIKNPKIMKLAKPKIEKTNKTPEEALSNAFSLIIPNIDKEKNIFEQGMTDYDIIKLITRCGENGYVLNMKDVFEGPTFNQIVKKLKLGK